MALPHQAGAAPNGRLPLVARVGALLSAVGVVSLAAIPYGAISGNSAEPPRTVTAVGLHGWPMIVLVAAACAAPAWRGWATRRMGQLFSIAVVIAAVVEMVTRELMASALGNGSPGPFICMGSVTVAMICSASLTGRGVQSHRRPFIGVAFMVAAIALWLLSSNALLPHAALAGTHGSVPLVDALLDAGIVVLVALSMVGVFGTWRGSWGRGRLASLIASAVVIAAAAALSVDGPHDSWAYLWARNQGEVVLGPVQPVTVADDSGHIVATTTGPILWLPPGHYVIRSVDPMAKSGPACDPSGSTQLIVSRGVVTSVFESVCFA